jgi:hypothetical protein
MPRFLSDSQRHNIFCCAVLACFVLLSGLMHRCIAQESAGENLALGRTCRFSPQPNYRYCTDPEDPSQLTDGKTTEEYFWTQQGTVGWSGASFATLTIDLGKVEPIGGASLRTAAGRAGVTWPMALYVLVSDDNKTYRLAGDLVADYLKKHASLPEDYAILRFASDGMTVRGRYVQFVLVPMPGGNYLFTDEIEVFRGEERLLSGTGSGRVVENAAALFRESRLQRSIDRRMNDDLHSVHALVESLDLSDTLRKELLGELDVLAGQTETLEPGEGASFRAVLPMGERHTRVFGVQAKAWKGSGHPGLTASAASPWDPIDPFAYPAAEVGRIRVDAMIGEARAAAFNLANSLDHPIRVRIHLEGLPGGATPDWICLHEVQWTDTSQLKPVASALPEVKPAGGTWTIDVPSGLVRQVWMTVRPQDMPSGEHNATVRIDAPEVQSLTVPFSVRIWPMQLPERTSLWLGGWCYTDGKGPGLTDGNRSEFVRHLQERHVNAPWASAAVLRSFEFVDGRPDKIRLDTERLDRWVADWPDAKAYLVFLAVAHHSGAIQTTLGGAEIGSPEFEQRVATWISAWVEHLRSKGIEPNRLGLLIHDEPHEGSEIGPLLAWARAIRKAEPEVLIWEDTTYQEPHKAPAELFEICSILCPNRPMWLSQPNIFEDFYRKQREAGRTLQLYSCSGPARLLDPYSYYRLQAWHAWQIGATGSFFWAFGDNSGTSSWNEYYASRGPYTPLFLDDTSVTPGKQMEAIRESVEDYETLVMLRDAIAVAKKAGRDDEAVQRAEILLGNAAERVLRDASSATLMWHTPKDRSVADLVRVELLGVLAELVQETPVGNP